ncbi:phosphotransferase [Allorhizocola rhizosphaerae]|uniref:phosphotransferase n=1 Tax=Allorhizocola rhizosphaerae TaxID=1872709 RepID=UPI000E3EE2FE|nr:phosphotransferase [Allorhizocola rhizosphaerae]
MTSPIASGRDADVYALDDTRVLRRYRKGGDVTGEAEVMSHVGSLGYPVPQIYAAGGADLVMDRVHGPTMLEVVLAQQLSPIEAGEALAELHNRLHALPPLRSREPGHTVLHLDLHPANVILADDGPVVIDWRNSTDGPPGFDCAVSAVIIAQESVLSPTVAKPARHMLRAFTAGVRHPLAPHLTEALAYRAADPAQDPHEIAALDRARQLINAEL